MSKFSERREPGRRLQFQNCLVPWSCNSTGVKRAFNRYKAKNIYLETKVIAEGNTSIKNLLLSHGHLIPAELLDDAGRLVEHFEVWLEEFERVRDEKKPELETQFVFAGPQGFGSRDNQAKIHSDIS